MNLFKNLSKKTEKNVLKMLTTEYNSVYVWDGNLFESDLVRACIRPYTKAIGKTVAKHIRKTVQADGSIKIDTNPDVYMRFLLSEPNQLMTMQQLLEKTATQLILNNNAFVLIVRDDRGYPCELYPLACTVVETIKSDNKILLRFYFQNGNSSVFDYDDIIHLRSDFYENDIFGTSPATALVSLMENIGSVDKSLKNAIKNSGIVRWLLRYAQSLRKEDLKENVSDFVKNYLDVESDTFGAAGVDGKVADVIRVEPKDYVPNAALTKQLTERLYSFFNTNDKITASTYTEDEWISYYESVIEPVVEQMSAEFTRKLFTRRERGFGNVITFESSNLTFASMSTKLNLVSFVDRGIMTPNEVRAVLNLAPIDGGDRALLRKDTGRLDKDKTGEEQSGDMSN